MKITKTKNSILIEFTDRDLEILADSLIDPLAWFETLANEKLANCGGRLKEFWLKKFQNEKSVENIPTDDTLLLDLIFSYPEYKSRVDRQVTETIKKVGQ